MWDVIITALNNGKNEQDSRLNSNGPPVKLLDQPFSDPSKPTNDLAA